MTTPAPSRLLCPNCHRALKEVHEAGISYLGCLKCFGIFISPSELRKYVSSSTNDVKVSFDKISEIRPLQKVEFYNPNRTCPICSTPLDQYQYCFNSGVKIDGCPSGHGVFFDLGELAKARKFVHDGKSKVTASESALFKKSRNLLEQDALDSGANGHDKASWMFYDLLQAVWNRFKGDDDPLK